MSVSLSSSRRRLSLLAGSSLAALTLATSFGLGAAVTLTPGVAAAQDECGAAAGNGAAPDVFVCSGAYPTGITYNTNGNLTLGLGAGIVLNNQGIHITAAPGNNIGVLGTASPNNTFIDAAGNGITFLTNGSSSAISITDGFPTIAGTAHGIFVQHDNGGDVFIEIADGVINGGSAALHLVYDAPSVSGNIDISLGQTELSGGDGIVVSSSLGAAEVSIVGGQSITATDSDGTGIQVVTINDITVALSGDITAGGDGVNAIVLDSLDADQLQILTGTVTAGGAGILARNEGEGGVFIQTTGAVIGGRGILAETSVGSIDITTGGAVTGTSNVDGQGIYAQTTAGDITIDTTAGLVTGFFTGVSLDSQSGDINATLGDIVSTNSFGLVVFTDSGDIDINQVGDIGGVVGMSLFSATGDIDLDIGAGSTVGGDSVAVDILNVSGSIDVTLHGDTTAAVLLETGSASVAQVGLGIFGDINVSNGSAAIGITGADGAVGVALFNGSSVTNTASGGAGIAVETDSGNILIQTSSSASITASGANGVGIDADSEEGEIHVDSN